MPGKTSSFTFPPAQRAHRPLVTCHLSLVTSAAAFSSLTTIAALTLALSLPPASRAEPAAADPTQPSPALAAALRTRLADLSDLTLRALVVAPDGEGAALIGTRDLPGAPVRPGTILNQDIDGVTVPLTVESITPTGVLLRTSPTTTLSGRIRRAERIRSRILISAQPSVFAFLHSSRTRFVTDWI